MSRLYPFRYEVRDFVRKMWSNTIGWRLALWLDKKHPEWCWAGIATTVGLGYSIQDFNRQKEGSGCKRECEQIGRCWCGKFTKEANDV
jgi:hypothetical protein